MKRLFISILTTLAMTACGGSDPAQAEEPETPAVQDTTATADTPVPGAPGVEAVAFACGADISWVTEQEADGIKFYNAQGKETDCFDLMKEIGMNAIRLRVWVNPETPAKKDAAEGGYGSPYCGKADVVAKAVRANKAGLAVMIDFHYSDIFADPSRQATPLAWRGKTQAEIEQLVAEHTTDVLAAVKAEGVEPQWIQIGNETRPGMLHPYGQLWDSEGDIKDGWKHYAALTNAGYNAAKAACPDAKVMVHIDNAYEDNTWWFDKLKAAGGKFDMIGLSHYPMLTGKMTWQQANDQAIQHVREWAAKYKVPIMVSEVGVKVADSDAASCMNDFMTRVKAIDQCAGVFYWEPQVYGGWRPSVYKTVFGWGSYDMGGFTPQGKPAALLDAMR